MSVPRNARELAYLVLRKVRRETAYTNLTLSSALARSPGLEAAERGLATELVYGVLRQRRMLDHALQLHSNRSLGKVNADVLDLMRIAAYQVLMLDRTPAYAAVDHAVGAVRRVKGAKVAGYVNAVLRRLEITDLRRDLPEEPLERLALTCSVPTTLAQRWVEQLGLAEAEQLGRRLLERAPLTIRANTLRTGAEDLAREIAREGGTVKRCGRSPSALQVSRLPDPFSARSFRRGLWTAQDEAAQLVTDLLAPRPGELVLDTCSGVGGKATHAAAQMEDRGQVLCLDISQAKLRLLVEHCGRLGVTVCRPLRADARGVAQGLLPDLAVERVMVDAPCTGLGLLQRHPELKWREGGEEALERLVELQRQLLRSAARVLRPGGVLVYSVCTITDEEGPQQVDWLLSQRSDLDLDLDLDSAASSSLPVEETTPGMIRLWPHRHGTDGFFIARFRRVG